ncbi:MAG: fibronectin type III domain-containing protein, partial [Eggerthella lenta]
MVVAPERVDAVAGDSALVDDFLAKASGVGEGQSLAYQWQVQLAGTWTNLPGQTGERTHLSLANLEAGEYSLRCVVTATAPGGKSKTIESSEVTLALSPATPSGLDVREATRDTATLAWTWAGPGTVDSFNVRYREEGATDLDWVAVPAEKIDPASMTCTIEGLAPGTSYEWQVQAVQGGQVSKWAASGFVTQSGGSLKVARIWPPDVAVAADEQAKFAAFTNRGDADDVSYEWQYRSLGSPEDAWETIPNATGRILKLDANTTGYVRCVATQAPPSAGAAEVAGAAETPETPEVADVAEVAASNETLGMNEAPEANETNEPLAVTEADEAPETNEAPGTPEVAEVAETFAAPEPVVVVSNQARVRVTPSVPSSLAVGEVGFTDAALSWAAADVDGAAFSLAYRVAGSSEWTEITGLTVPACELDGLVQGASYEWRVQAVVGEGDDALASA